MSRPTARRGTILRDPRLRQAVLFLDDEDIAEATDLFVSQNLNSAFSASFVAKQALVMLGFAILASLVVTLFGLMVEWMRGVPVPVILHSAEGRAMNLAIGLPLFVFLTSPLLSWRSRDAQKKHLVEVISRYIRWPGVSDITIRWDDHAMTVTSSEAELSFGFDQITAWEESDRLFVLNVCVAGRFLLFLPQRQFQAEDHAHFRSVSRPEKPLAMQSLPV